MANNDNSPAVSFDTILAGLIEEGKKNKPKRGRPRKAAPKETKGDSTKPAPVKPVYSRGELRIKKRNRIYSARWVDEKVVCMVTHIYCTHCKTLHESLQSRLYLRRYHPLYGLHYQTLNESGLMQHGHLPRDVEYSREKINHCHLCIHKHSPHMGEQMGLNLDIPNYIPREDKAPPELASAIQPLPRRRFS